MKHLSLLMLIMAFSAGLRADHITGGEMYYTVVSRANGSTTYQVTLKQFRSCATQNRSFYNPIYIGVYNRATNAEISILSVPLAREEQLSFTSNDPCITRPPLICYYVGYWNFHVTLQDSPEGYILTSQVTNRVNQISNLEPGYDRIGATYTAEIPGTAQLAAATNNHSARFTGTDLVTVCADNPFRYSFAAEDPDGDELRYYFCEAYQTIGYASGGPGPGGGGATSQPTVPPPYQSVPYGAGYSQDAPLGVRVSIDPVTGLITGIAPEVGIYVVTVCVQELRNGIVIATQRKDLQLNITGCTLASATLLPEYMLCGTSQQLVVANQSTSPLIARWNWEFRNAAGQLVYSSANPVADFTFSQPGTYSVKLTTNRGLQCPDSTEALALVYPGFNPAFSSAGNCIARPVSFTDQTSTAFGTVNYWNWDFGEAITMSDRSEDQNPSWTYPSNGRYTVTLIAHNSVGCKDTVQQTIDILDKPLIGLAFRDTLICPPDPLTLRASGSGNFTWSPAVNMTGSQTATPNVNVTSDTKYYVDLDQNGCQNRDSVFIRTTDQVTLQMPADTLICQGDTIRLRVQSNGLIYNWTAAPGLLQAAVPAPLVNPPGDTRYFVTASVSACTASGSVWVRTVPYPLARAGNDTIICFGTEAQLHGVTDGSGFAWSPVLPGTPDPVVRPAESTAYIFTATDTRGCPKPSRDTVLVTVLPKVMAYAGRDTAVVVGQPLQLHASGGTRYEWSPAAGLSDPGNPDPIAVYRSANKGLRLKVLVQDQAGCADSAFLTVKVYNTLPQVFVPTAFTPNGDGVNDWLRPIGAGISEIRYFRVYNRWGQLVYSGNENNRGWDGRTKGVLQDNGTYVWQVNAVDYFGADFFLSGTATLLR
ncbi:PKD domain-containing protein [Chitinophaga rhizosphaerae]|uniref:PKD domain-containing protein n=1 Tax=Chitinophaga rhizosphaerae TaxID=1864947 RepID=UPI000F7FC035|nr:PKD domain-containing protein [Chitinophaga rhizosphaerae]